MESKSETNINIPGNENTIIAHAENVNLSSSNVYLIGEDAKKQEIYEFGDLKISFEDKKLIDEFKVDYDPVIEYCVKTDFTVPGIDIELYDKIDIPYRSCWNIKSLKFKNKELKKTVIDTLSSLIELSQYLDNKYMRVIELGNHSHVLIARNESMEEGNQLREIIRPETMKLRYRLRDLYRDLHPEEYEGVPPFEDHYEEN